jgi:hypothetical protein
LTLVLNRLGDQRLNPNHRQADGDGGKQATSHRMYRHGAVASVIRALPASALGSNAWSPSTCRTIARIAGSVVRDNIGLQPTAGGESMSRPG